MGSSNTDDAYCLKWNDFHTSITASFSDLKKESELLDAIVICEGQQLRAHRLVLSACSGVFRQLFRLSSLTKSDHPVVLLWDVKVEDLKLLFNFMYEGQVNVAQEHLTNFLALAERLQVRGLTSGDSASKTSPGFPVQQAAANARLASSAKPATSQLARRQRSSPMAVTSNFQAAKRIRPIPTMDESSQRDIDELPHPPPVKQELRVDESGTIFPSGSSAAQTASSGFTGNSASGFGSFFNGSNANEGGTREFDANSGTSSLSEGFGLQPEAMIDEESKDDMYDVDDDDEETWQHASGGEGSSGPPGSGQVGNSANRLQGCPYCGKELRNMTRHIEDVHCPVEIPCGLCGKICTSRNKLRTHQAQVCNKKFL